RRQGRSGLSSRAGSYTVAALTRPRRSLRSSGATTIQEGTVLIVAGSFEVDPARREEFLRNREAAMRSARQQQGCRDYVLAADPIEPARVVLFELWEGKEELAAHLAAIRGNTPSADDVPVLSRTVAQYEIAAVGKVGS